MKTIVIRNFSYIVPKRHQLSSENRKVTIKTPFTTVIRRLSKDNFQETQQRWVLEHMRKGMENDTMEINGELFKVKSEKTERSNNE